MIFGLRFLDCIGSVFVKSSLECCTNDSLVKVCGTILQGSSIISAVSLSTASWLWEGSELVVRVEEAT